MRTQQEIINELNVSQTVFNKLIMEVGQLYAQYRLTDNQNLLSIINSKVESSQQIELRLKLLEQELIKT